MLPLKTNVFFREIPRKRYPWVQPQSIMVPGTLAVCSSSTSASATRSAAYASGWWSRERSCCVSASVAFGRPGRWQVEVRKPPVCDCSFINAKKMHIHSMYVNVFFVAKPMVSTQLFCFFAIPWLGGASLCLLVYKANWHPATSSIYLGIS